MRTTLVLVILALTSADHWTTYLCLTQASSGWVVTEANPIAGWLFAHAGIVPGLVIDSLVTVAALVFLAGTQRFSPRLRIAMLGVVALATGYAVANNIFAIQALGIPLFGSA